MKKILYLFVFVAVLFGQNLYFEAFKDIMKGKRIINQNPKKAEKLFTIAANDLSKIIHNSIENNKPSANAIELMGELYLNGWGVEKNEKKAEIFLCVSAKLGNFKAKQLIKKNEFICHQTNIKEIKQ